MKDKHIKFKGQALNGEWYTGNLCVITKTGRGGYPIAGHYISNSVGMPYAYPVRPDTVHAVFPNIDGIRESLRAVLKPHTQDDCFGEDYILVTSKVENAILSLFGYSEQSVTKD